MIDVLCCDWRTAAGHWPLIADDCRTRPLARVVQRLLCQRCERYYLSTSPAPGSTCPDCGHDLDQVDLWDLGRQSMLPWWGESEDVHG